jgi:hypothetical protein
MSNTRVGQDAWLGTAELTLSFWIGGRDCIHFGVSFSTLPLPVPRAPQAPRRAALSRAWRKEPLPLRDDARWSRPIRG